MSLCLPRAFAYMARVGLWRSLVSASVWGTEGREFESRQPDHFRIAHPLRVGVLVSADNFGGPA